MSARWLIMAAALAGSFGCLMDTGAPCRGGFEEDTTGACVCPAGSVPVLGQCQACARHERAVGASCECESGYGREPGTSQCELIASDAGDVPVAAGPCSNSAQCGTGSVCDVYGSGECAAAPMGLGQACTNSSDCAATEATYCEAFSSRSCQVQGCKELLGNCPGDFACCDFAILATSLCVASDALQAGQCPAPGQLVPRQVAE